MPVLSTLGAAIANVYGFTSGLIKDQYFNLVSLLLPGNGTNGAQNNTFLDSGTANSGSGFTITRNGNTTQGTFSPFSQTGWGNYFNGSSYLQVASNAAFAFGTGDFSIEFWFYPTVAATQRNISFPTANAPIVNMTSSRTLEFGNYGISTIATTSNTLTLNAWNFCAASRVSGTLRLFINGVQGASVSDSTNFVQSLVNIGTDTGGIFATGYMADVRIVKGSGFTTSTVPTAPLTAISGTSLLTCQSNRFRDASGNGFTITTSGSPSVVAFSPFAPTQFYSASAVGGSGYFDGTGDYLTANSAGLELGSNLFTIDGWFYCTGYNGGGAIYSSVNTYPSSTGLLFYVNSTGGYVIDVNGTNIISTGTAPLNTWTHFAIVRSSTGSNGVTLYINGSALTPGTSATNFSSTYAVIGRTGFGAASNYWLGYLSGIRVVVGSANVPSSVPTSPPTAITNTVLLLNFTNAGVVDATAKNVLETVGNAQISTTQSKWGGGSMAFDGNGDRATMPGSAFLALGSGDFTVEAWVYKSANTAYMTLAGNWASAGENTWQILADATGNKICWFAVSGFVLTSSATLNTGTWYYIAFVRSGSATNNFKLYINGSLDSQATMTTDYNNTARPLFVGHTPALDAGRDWNGYVDDFRITKGYARTVTTVPTAPFPVQ